MRTVIIGCGSPLAADDGIGPEVVRQLENIELPPGVEVIAGGTPGLGLLDWLEGCERAILVDAVRSGGEPGAVYRLTLDAMLQGGPAPLSAHDLNLVDALMLGYRAEPERMPGEIVVIGIEAACAEKMCVGLSPQVQAAIPEAVSRVLQEINR
ncbi:MAG: hydrogenase maturation protease [Armatimonadetes bacterium]|nr:hydrogenase maturation protease [Armatimonadota bacterium]